MNGNQAEIGYFKGKYCTVYLYYNAPDDIRQGGVCIPDSCSSEEAVLYASAILPAVGITGTVMPAATCAEEKIILQQILPLWLS